MKVKEEECEVSLGVKDQEVVSARVKVNLFWRVRKEVQVHVKTNLIQGVKLKWSLLPFESWDQEFEDEVGHLHPFGSLILEMGEAAFP